MLRAPLPTTLNYYLATHSNDSFWTVQKDQASLSAVLPTTPRRPVQTGRLHLAEPKVCRRRCLSSAASLAISSSNLSKTPRAGPVGPDAHRVPLRLDHAQ